MGWFSAKEYGARFTGLMSGIEYEERGRRMTIQCEMLVNPPRVLVYTGTMKWQPPHEAELVEASQIERIKKNIAETLHTVVFEWA